ncbi:hypothetical protein Q5P01_008608 [Channa striata]|uniref:Uncharacterized protein n=1 Tax=Channa striata TaxID=64152 RepID=A0AA88N2V5_CHASR|nr:hypothetical protein Q5P01_008608 [Channa striata]
MPSSPFSLCQISSSPITLPRPRAPVPPAFRSLYAVTGLKVNGINNSAGNTFVPKTPQQYNMLRSHPLQFQHVCAGWQTHDKRVEKSEKNPDNRPQLWSEAQLSGVC